MGTPARPAIPRLHLVTNRRLCPPGAQAGIVGRAARGGLGAVQLREKDLDESALRDEAAALRAVLGDTSLLVNGAMGVARAVGAAGVHLPEGAGGVAAARAALGPHALIGRSVHDVAGAQSAAAEGADYLIVGTVYATDSKPGRTPAGPELIRAIAAAVPTPIIAIGGIDETNAAATIAAGAWGIAAMSSILRAPDPAAAVRRLRAAIGDVRGGEIGRGD
jgi:thiamine-phosphate diphosphorylase